MSPIEANIFIAEDNAKALEAASELLELKGHHVVETAGNPQEGLEKIPELEQKGVNVAILDGNLTEGDVSMKDGERMAEEIKKRYGNKIVIIGNSSQGPVKGADYQKSDIGNTVELAEFIKKL